MSDPMERQHGGNHYKSQSIQPIEYMRAVMSAEEFQGYCRGNALKYISRAGKKGDKKLELEKAIHYLEFWLGSL